VKKRKIKKLPPQGEGSPNTHSNPILKFETQMMKPSLYVILDLIIWAAAVWSHGMPPPTQGSLICRVGPPTCTYEPWSLCRAL